MYYRKSQYTASVCLWHCGLCKNSTHTSNILHHLVASPCILVFSHQQVATLLSEQSRRSHQCQQRSYTTSNPLIVRWRWLTVREHTVFVLVCNHPLTQTQHVLA